MTNIHFSNFTGSSSGANKRKVAKLVCSPNAVCANITLDEIDLISPYGSPPVVVCDGIQGNLGVPCLNSSDPAANNKLKRWGV